MRDVLGAGTAAAADPPDWWGASGVAGPGPGEPILIRVSFWSAALPGVLAAVDEAAGPAGLDPALGGSPAAGVLHLTLPATAPPGAVAEFLAGLRAALAGNLTPGAPGREGPPSRASAVVLTAPAAVRDSVDMWGPVPALSLMRAIKDRFDPGHLMAPGRFAGGI
ncbi:MAG: FAD-binding protein, partial [Streptosporangiales bacterium]